MKAILLVAGYGTRLDPLTKAIPKSMIPIMGKPILEHIIADLSQYGVKDIVLVTGYKQEQFHEYFGTGQHFGVEISYVTQDKIKGTGNALKIAKQQIDDEPFLLYLGDTLIPQNISSFFSPDSDDFEIKILTSNNPEKITSSGMIITEGDMVTEIKEKPKNAQSSLSWAGLAIFKSRKIFDFLETFCHSDTTESEITDAMNQMIKNNYVVKNHNCKKYFDIGTPAGLLDAVKFILQKKPKTTSHSTFIEPVYCGNNVVIGKNSIIGPFVSIGHNVLINDNVKIKNSLVCDNSVVSSKDISDSIVFGQSEILHP